MTNVFHQIADFLAEDPSRWTQGASARLPNGDKTNNMNAAVCWCALGLVVKFSADSYRERTERIDALERTLGSSTFLPHWNDKSDRTVTEVIALFRETGDRQSC
jgi:hypothetical protein